MKHPSHPQHDLRFSKETRWYTFPCNACGATVKGGSCTCTLCDYSIHQRCALLPLSEDFPHHHHALSLAFSPPSVYLKFGFDCGICSKPLSLIHWVYHCSLCRYVVHINCATSTEDGDKTPATKFPIAIEEMYEEMIRPFIKRQKAQILNPDHDNHNISGKYKFSKHPHDLTFTTFSSASSSPLSHDPYKRDEDDEDDFSNIPKSELICDGCTLGIHERKQTDGDGYESGYMSCDECKYFLHLSCFNLPLEIPSLPIHPLKDHNITLQNVDSKLTGWIECDICNSKVNGLYYHCTICRFNIDIKCASLPNNIKHASHPRHEYFMLIKDRNIDDVSFCVNCNMYKLTRMGHFKCITCRIGVCGKCMMLPARNKHRLENHLLSLTYDAYVNRPGDFYCSSCENQMHPRLWMYHCRDCDQSFHPECFPATSGEYRNIIYGTEQLVISSIHDHPLRFQIITSKKRCDLCRFELYDAPGLQCASCFFAVCISCTLKHMGDANKAI
ncbi:uncharacterized protein LOC125185515 [Salvia hispanica]|uniref:uncharacterized protein LOC125185515 n=1 Tax=Salvia hispanica TaxID=49212 RepID=UPI0020094F6C|nr:uncharacterized protein LOC125185515 [Salvia hispanica]